MISFGRSAKGVGLGASGVGMVIGDSGTVPVLLLLPLLKEWDPKLGICIFGQGLCCFG